VVAALRSDAGASRQLLMAAFDGAIIMLVSVPLMLEYEAVLTRAEQLVEIGLNRQEMNEILDAVTSVAEPVDLQFHWRPRLTDPADEMVLETAVNGCADRLVTFNQRHFAEAAGSFGIRVSPPAELWHEIRGAKPS
jgi:putative PIN family toxin of toxin-antitoxin system